jgi:tripartite-type tricarboxylate transporter receptor subunit TctC
MTWNGLMAPAAVPKEIIGRIATAVEAAAKDADFAKRLASFGVDPVGSTPEQFAATIAADLALWGEAVKLAGIGEK